MHSYCTMSIWFGDALLMCIMQDLSKLVSSNGDSVKRNEKQCSK